MDKIKNCIIARYDETIKEPPFLTIKLDTVKVSEPELNDLGVAFAMRLKLACRLMGYNFKFYTMSSEEGFDYEIVVY